VELVSYTSSISNTKGTTYMTLKYFNMMANLGGLEVKRFITKVGKFGIVRAQLDIKCNEVDESLKMEVHRDRFKYLNMDENLMINDILEIQGINRLMDLYLRSRIAVGPRIVEATDNNLDRLNFEALENIDLNITVPDIELPFPTLVITLPETYSENKQCYDISQVNRLHKPVLAIIDKPHHNLVIFGIYLFRTGDAVPHDSPQVFTFPLFNAKSNPEETIEEMLVIGKDRIYKRSLRVSDVEWNNVIDTTRAVVNLCSLMMGDERIIRKIGAPNPSHKDRLIDRIKRKVRIEQNQEELDWIPEIWRIEQHVRLFHYQNEKSESESEKTGKILKPHWRRGHRRRQHYGPENSLTKIILVKPVLVNSKYFKGGPEDATYHGRV